MLNQMPLLTQSELQQAIVRDVLVVSPELMAIEAIDRLNNLRIKGSPSNTGDRSIGLHMQARASCIAIVADGKFVGILTTTDVIRLCAERRDLAHLAIVEVANLHVVTLQRSEFTDLAVALDLLDRYQFTHLPIVDDRDTLVGVVTNDILHYCLSQALTVQCLRLETEQIQQLEDRARESQQFLQTAIETFPLAVFWKDRESRYLGCNYNFARDANLSLPEQIVGKTDYDLPWGEAEADRYRADDRQVIASGEPKLGIIETQLQADGSTIWLETNKLPLQNLDGETIGILGTYQNITERKQAESELQRLSDRLSLSLKSASVGCWEWDIVKNCLIWDDRMYELYGLPLPAPDSERREAYTIWSKTVHPEDLLATEALLAQSLSGQADFNTEFRVIHPDGSIHFIKAYGLVQYDKRERPHRMTGINFDITAAKEDESIRRQAEQTIRQQAEREFVLREITQKIRKSLELPLVFETAVREIREFLQTDRVGVFKFSEESNFGEGEFVAESVAQEFAPILGVKLRDPNFRANLARYYQQGIVNIVEDIHLAGLLDEEVSLLAKFQVKANLVIPLLDGHQLWGFICIHHCARDRAWQQSEINFVNQIAEQIEIGIQQATLYAKVQSELESRWQVETEIAHQLKQQQALGTIAQQIRNSLEIEQILATATAQVQELTIVDRVAIFRVSADRQIQAVAEIVSPTYPSLLDRNWSDQRIGWQEFQFYLEGKPNIVNDVRQDPWSENLHDYIDAIGVKSKIVAPILLPYGDGETITDSDERRHCQIWGLLSVHACGTLRHWQDAEAQLLQQIADQLALAIQQASLFEQVQAELVERQQAEIQLRQSNEELARATRLKDEFLASMSHELRTPLNAILGISEGLQMATFGALSDRQQQSIATIEKSGRHLLALINDILDLSKIEANQFSLELTDVTIRSLCHNSTLFIKELAHKKQITVKTQIPSDLQHLKIQVDDLRFRQVLINLLSNAVKFTPAGGCVTLDVRLEVEAKSGSSSSSSLQSSSCQIAFSIIDTGIGIAPKDIDKLFQSFVQIDSSLNRQYAGTGLGLALVKRIAELHGGRVSVQSEVDRGSCFTIFLPFEPSVEMVVAASAVNEQIATAPEELPAIREKALILVVEDNDANMETMVGYLQIRGYRSIEAENGRQAIELTQLHHPDLILMDIQMPGMDGYEAIGQIRQLPDCAAIPIVALTALAMPPDRQKCLDAGADCYVTKPVKLSQLVSTIETLLHGD